MENKKLDKYLIEKDKTDMVSSLMKINKNILKEAMEEKGIKSVEKLAKKIIEEFKYAIVYSKDDELTQIFFKRLISNENSMTFSAYEQDVENFIVFVYKEKEYYSYYIPSELKKIIKKELGF